MNITSENLDVESYRSALMKEGVAVNRVAFSTKTMKFNRHGKVNERVLVITQNKLIKMDPAKKFKVMMSVNLADVESVSLSPDEGNQLVVVHLRQPANDLIMSLTSLKQEDLVGELVGVLASRYARLTAKQLPVTASNVLKFQSGKKVQSITINARQVDGLTSPMNNNNNYQSEFVKSKSGGIVYTAFAK